MKHEDIENIKDLIKYNLLLNSEWTMNLRSNYAKYRIVKINWFSYVYHIDFLVPIYNPAIKKTVGYIWHTDAITNKKIAKSEFINFIKENNLYLYNLDRIRKIKFLKLKCL